jgi:hypothetical protein
VGESHGSFVEEANQWLKQAKVGICIEQHGNRLHLRGTLPPKPNSRKQKPYQQRIAFKVYANPKGVLVQQC